MSQDPKPDAERAAFDAWLGQRRLSFVIAWDAWHARAALAQQDAAASSDTIDALRAEVERLRAVLADVDANMRQAWKAGTLSADAWPVALAKRVTDAAMKEPK